MRNTTNNENLTNFYMNLCYTCLDANECREEEACRACWADQGVLDAAKDDTQELLQAYYA